MVCFKILGSKEMMVFQKSGDFIDMTYFGFIILAESVVNYFY